MLSLFLGWSSNICPLLRTRRHLLVMWKLADHSCARCLRGMLGSDMGRKVWVRFRGGLRGRVFVSLVLSGMLARMKLFECSLVFKCANLLLRGAWIQKTCVVAATDIGHYLRIAWLMHRVHGYPLRALLSVRPGCRASKVLKVLVHGKWSFVIANTVAVRGNVHFGVRSWLRVWRERIRWSLRLLLDACLAAWGRQRLSL